MSFLVLNRRDGFLCEFVLFLPLICVYCSVSFITVNTACIPTVLGEQRKLYCYLETLQPWRSSRMIVLPKNSNRDCDIYISCSGAMKFIVSNCHRVLPQSCSPGFPFGGISSWNKDMETIMTTINFNVFTWDISIKSAAGAFRGLS